MNDVIWLTGQSGSGKTSLARALQAEMDCVVLDGDEMRKSISVGAGFSRSDRLEHNLRVARLAKVLAEQKTVVVSVIAPMLEAREEIDKICSPVWVYVKRTMPEREGHFYEEPDCFTVDHDKLSVKESCGEVRKHLGVSFEKHCLFIGRWQPLHDGHLKLFDLVRREGKRIAIGIRNTAIDESNPYSVPERAKMIKEKVPDAKIVVLPDIEAVCYGRGVGYEVRELRLDSETEAISATNIRKGGKRGEA